MDELLWGFALQDSHFDGNWLYLPTAPAQHLNCIKKGPWLACHWNSGGLILFLRYHWDEFWDAIKTQWNLDEFKLAQLQRRSTHAAYKVQAFHRNERSYQQEYLVFPRNFVNDLYGKNTTNRSCQLGGYKFWIDVTRGRSLGAQPLALIAPEFPQISPALPR